MIDFDRDYASDMPTGPQRTPRFSVTFQLTATTAAHTEVRGTSSDISVAGMGATMLGEIPTGEEVTLAFVLPKVHENLCVRAVVSHRDRFRHGFEFVELTPHARKTIEELCELLPALV